MKIADGVFLGGGTAEQKFHFSIPLLDVYSAHYGVKVSFREGEPRHTSMPSPSLLEVPWRYP
jgi:hypothetical protein